MKNNAKDKEFKKTQSGSSPGALGEDVNRNKRKSSDPIPKQSRKTAQEKGLNEQRSAGDSGAFEGLENTGE